MKETKIQTSFTRADTNETQSIKDAIAKHWNATIGEFFKALASTPGVDVIHVEKKVLGRFVKVGEYIPGEVAPETIEGTILETWGPAEYNIRAVCKGHYIGAAKNYGIGGAEAIARSEPTIRGYQGTLDDADAELAALAKQQRVALALKTNASLLKEPEGGEDMKAEQLLTLAAALKPTAPDLTPFMTMMETSRREAAERADKAEQRNHELQMKLLEMQTTVKTTDASTSLSALSTLVLPVLEFVKPFVPKGAMATLLSRFTNSPAPAGGWTPEAVMQAVSVAAPMVQSLVTPFIEALKNRPQVVPAPMHPPQQRGILTPDQLPTPPPMQNGGAVMPNPIFDALVAELRKPGDDRDYDSLVAFLDTVAGPVAGTTAMHLFENLAQTKDHLARVSLGQYDPRLVDAETWPGVVGFLTFLREAASRQEEPEPKDAE